MTADENIWWCFVTVLMMKIVLFWINLTCWEKQSHLVEPSWPLHIESEARPSKYSYTTVHGLSLIFKRTRKKKSERSKHEAREGGSGEVSEAIQRRPALSIVPFCAGIPFLSRFYPRVQRIESKYNYSLVPLSETRFSMKFRLAKKKGKALGSWERGCSNRGIVWGPCSFSFLFSQPKSMQHNFRVFWRCCCFLGNRFVPRVTHLTAPWGR